MLSAIVFRQCRPDCSDVSEATLRASAREGGRFNPQHEFGAIDVSLSRDTAVAELHRRAQRLGVDVADLFPRTMIRLKVKLERVLDLTNPRIAADWGLSSAQFTSDDFTPCQEVARGARRDGYEAIRFPAASGAGENAAIFLDRMHPDSTVVVEGSDELMPEGPTPAEMLFLIWSPGYSRPGSDRLLGSSIFVGAGSSCLPPGTIRFPPPRFDDAPATSLAIA